MTTSSNPPALKNSPENFDEAFESLETILTKFQSESPTLEEALAMFEEGVGYVRYCETQLSKAKGRVDELVSYLQETGEAVTKPFETC